MGELPTAREMYDQIVRLPKVGLEIYVVFAEGFSIDIIRDIRVELFGGNDAYMVLHELMMMKK